MNPAKALVEYLRSSKAELEKVSWPSKKDTLRYSSLVLGVSVVMATFFAALDAGLSEVLTAALTRTTNGAVQQAPVEPAAQVVPDLELESIDSETVIPTDNAPAPTPTDPTVQP